MLLAIRNKLKKALPDDCAIGYSCKHTKSKRREEVINPAVLTEITQWRSSWSRLWIPFCLGWCRRYLCGPIGVGINVRNTLSLSYLSKTNRSNRAPTSGGQYHWTSMLAPRSCMKLMSYLTGGYTISGAIQK